MFAHHHTKLVISYSISVMSYEVYVYYFSYYYINVIIVNYLPTVAVHLVYSIPYMAKHLHRKKLLWFFTQPQIFSCKPWPVGQQYKSTKCYNKTFTANSHFPSKHKRFPLWMFTIYGIINMLCS